MAAVVGVGGDASAAGSSLAVRAVVVGACLIDDAAADLGALKAGTVGSGAAAVTYACTNGTAATIVPAAARVQLQGRSDPSRRLDVQLSSAEVTGDGRGAVAALKAAYAPPPGMAAEVFEGDVQVSILPAGGPAQGRSATLHIRAMVD